MHLQYDRFPSQNRLSPYTSFVTKALPMLECTIVLMLQAAQTGKSVYVQAIVVFVFRLSSIKTGITC